MAEIFNNYFTESGLSHSLALTESEFDKHPKSNLINEIVDDQDQEFSFSFQPVTAKYVWDLLSHPNGSKATGVDGIPPRLLKASAPASATPLSRLINYCLKQSCWISKWKSSNISPVFKKGCEATKVNYRPISILPCVSKIFEQIMYEQLYNYFVSRRLLSDSLSGFLKGHSCCMALLKITEGWREALDERKTVSAVSIDLSKAFDSICHCLLIRKLAAYGLLDHSIQLICSYLINHKQRVKIENAYSNWRVVQCGVLQGSLLGPLLFNIYINDITYVTKNMELRLYADDTTGYAASNSPATLEFYINSDLVRLSQWLEDSYLTINTTKTQAMIVGKSNYNYELLLKSTNILTIVELKLLGVSDDR